MMLQSNRTLTRNSGELGIVDDKLVIERDRQSITYHYDSKRIPFANRAIGLDLRRHTRANFFGQGWIGAIAPDFP